MRNPVLKREKQLRELLASAPEARRRLSSQTSEYLPISGPTTSDKLRLKRERIANEIIARLTEHKGPLCPTCGSGDIELNESVNYVELGPGGKGLYTLPVVMSWSTCRAQCRYCQTQFNPQTTVDIETSCGPNPCSEIPLHHERYNLFVGAGSSYRRG